ncbi:MAG TPA: DUF2520 domain-containing protein [Ignavibacteria bacterium]|nr:DUF2520 domain-containing protein [Ignavibacteria bacterium]
MNKNVYIIGAGNAGSAFAFELNEIGFKVNFLTDRNIENVKRVSDKLLPLETSNKTEGRFIEASGIILICVQDRFIKDVINEIISTKADLKDKYFIHISGSLSSEIFPEEEFKKSYTGSMHPVQTFAALSVENNKYLSGIYFGIEGKNECIRLMKKIISNFRSEFLEIPSDKKYIYHSACVVASNFLVTLMNISAELLASIGIEKSRSFEIFRPIVMKTIENISDNGLVNSLTGPFERNDIETVSNQLNSIYKELPSLIPFYTLLGMETVKIAFRKETLNLNNVISMLDLMNTYVSNEVKNEKIN